MSDKADIAEGRAIAMQLAVHLGKHASAEGCTGDTEFNCLEDEPEDPSQWCDGCLMSEAATLIKMFLASPVADPSKED